MRKEALDSVARQQKHYAESNTWRHLKLRSPQDLQPFAVIIATEKAREKVEHGIDGDMLLYKCLVGVETPGAHERRVRHLIDAWNGLEWLEMN